MNVQDPGNNSPLTTVVSQLNCVCIYCDVYDFPISSKRSFSVALMVGCIFKVQIGIRMGVTLGPTLFV